MRTREGNEPEGMVGPDLQEVGKGHIPREKRDPRVVEVKGGRGEPGHAKREGENDDGRDA